MERPAGGLAARKGVDLSHEENRGTGSCCEGSGGCGCSCGCSCCGEPGFKRRYQTRAEQIAELEGYLEELTTEVRAVEERLADLKRKR
jgi:hypothetical protein